MSDLLIDDLSDGVVVLDQDRRITRANAAAAARRGLSPEAMVGRNAAEIYPAVAPERLGEDHRATLRAGRCIAVERRSNSGSHWYEYRIHPTTSGAVALEIETMSPFPWRSRTI